MKRYKNKKGFTLIELLAVIVILAIIILIAMPNVLGAMERARKNTFSTEATSILKVAGTAYSDLAMSGSVGGSVCINVKDLGSQAGGQNYLSKDLTKYSGYVYLTINASSGAVTYSWDISNGKYRATTANTPNQEIKVEDIDSSAAAATAQNCAAAGHTAQSW